jgi:hypothetical protein
MYDDVTGWTPLLYLEKALHYLVRALHARVRRAQIHWFPRPGPLQGNARIPPRRG